MTNHDIPAEDISRAFELITSAAKKSDLPREAKTQYKISGNNYGYSELYDQKLYPENQRQGDHKEGFNLRAFESGKTFSAIPAIFQEHVQFIEDLFKIRKYPHIHISNNIKPP
ncbi:hypothetical protein INT46_009033, partial [Mucor plumbeus]